MKKTIKLWILVILTGFILSSCDLLIYNDYIAFWNDSSYRITVKCNVTKPSSFTIEPDTYQYTKSKVDGISNINISYNDNALVSISISGGNVYFKNK